ncbi:4Fe-4S binding protein [candidate division KSB1 bacterium]|nr:4Fe-4S binding protein [candidate division KSB1 bacterium]RQW00564.1 MAG: 4Fe-4S binding protein [candidate division KSB1 bacterium]
MRKARQLSQIFFLFLFFFLFLQARFPYERLLPSDLFLRSSPLIALTTFLSSWSLETKLVLGFIMLVLPLFLGRFFCGWICPLGTTLDFSDKVLFHSKHSRNKNVATSFRACKFVLLIALVVAALFSLQLVWFFDPVVILTRFSTLVLYPAFAVAAGSIFDAAFKLGIFEDQIYTLYHWAQKTILPVTPPHIIHGLPVLLLFLGILALGLVGRRFWCRAFCPLGALLGVFSKYRLLKRKVDSSCTSCSICYEKCRMHAIADDVTSTNPIECIECGECVDECPSHSISYGIDLPKQNVNSNVDLSRRRVIWASVGGLLGAIFVKTIHSGTEKTASVIRPPGAVPEALFLDKCIRCQACTRICASTGGCLQPSLAEAGLEGLWSPIVIPRLGYCEFNCTLCGQICPTGAIQPLTLEKKQQLKIGLAFIDQNRCIPWRENKDCLVCEEHCPLAEKAIKFDVREVRTNQGDRRVVRFPYVDENLCIGCGICETKCPVLGAPGIYLTAQNNQRIISVS